MHATVANETPESGRSGFLQEPALLKEMFDSGWVILSKL
jgi:hypothetical protein